MPWKRLHFELPEHIREELEMVELLASLADVEPGRLERAGGVERLATVHPRGFPVERLRQDEANQLAVRRAVQIEGGAGKVEGRFVHRPVLAQRPGRGDCF